MTIKNNPWNVWSIKAFTFLVCPDCDFKSQKFSMFKDHAVRLHPLAEKLFNQTPCRITDGESFRQIFSHGKEVEAIFPDNEHCYSGGDTENNKKNNEINDKSNEDTNCLWSDDSDLEDNDEYSNQGLSKETNQESDQGYKIPLISNLIPSVKDILTNPMPSGKNLLSNQIPSAKNLLANLEPIPPPETQIANVKSELINDETLTESKPVIDEKIKDKQPKEAEKSQEISINPALKELVLLESQVSCTSRKYCCPQCPSDFIDDWLLQNHMLSQHDDSVNFYVDDPNNEDKFRKSDSIFPYPYYSEIVWIVKNIS